MSKVKITADRCKRCGYCQLHCPKAAINFSSMTNVSGFTYPIIDEEKCTGCGICYITCPDWVFEILNGKDEK